MILASYAIGPSRIPGAGKGLFLDKDVSRGTVLVAPAGIRHDQLVRRRDLPNLADKLQSSSVRWFEDVCTVDPDWNDECYINHAFQPNGLWHLGFVFALNDLEAGSELTIDYRLLLGEGETPGFRDALTGLPIVGFDWRESVQRSAALLQDLMSNSVAPAGMPETAGER